MKKISELLRSKVGRKQPVVFAFGRLNPPTIGHQKLIDRVITMAKRVKGLPVLYVSATQDKKKNPLTAKQKVDYLKKIYSRGIQIRPAIGSERTFMEILKNRFDKKYTDVYMVAGSDRVLEFKRLIKQYNGKDYNFDVVEVISAGSRDPDAEGVTGISASKMREFAKNNDFKSFKQNLMTGTRENDAMKLFKDLKKGMGVNEAMAPEDENLRTIREHYHNNDLFNMGDIVENTKSGNVGKIIKRGPNYVQYEMEDGGVEKAWLDEITPANNIDSEIQVEDVDKKKLVLQKNSQQLKSFSSFEEEINSAKDSQQKNTDDEEKETKKAEKKARKLPIETPGQPKIASVDTWTQGPENANQIHTQRKFNIKTPGQVRDYAKFVDDRKFQKFEEVDIEEDRVAQDPDIKKRSGTQPKKYYTKLSKADKTTRDRSFKRYGKKHHDDPDAYPKSGKHPGDDDAKTKPSKFTKKFDKMYGEEETKEIKDIKSWSESQETIDKYRDEYGTEWREHLDKVVSEMIDDVLSENQGVRNKAKKTGMPYGILMKVYNRGMAAWRGGHRPGASQQQWAMARVNSFVTKSSGTWGKADSDLAAKVRAAGKG